MVVLQAHLSSERRCFVLGAAVALAIQEQALALREAGQHVHAVQLRQRQRVVAQPQPAQARHACSSLASVTMAIQQM